MGVIGCGGISFGHIRGIMESPDLEIGALCDILPGKLAEKAALCGAPADACYADYVEMMDSGRVDAVSICTPNNVHLKIALDAVARGIPFAVEKPVGMSVAEVAALAEAARGGDLPHMVCFSYRFKAAARYMRDLILSGALGKIYHINGSYYQAWGLPDAGGGGVPTPLVWRFVKEVAGSGALGDLGCHMLDLFRFITGREFVSIAADMDTFIDRRRLPPGGGGGNGIDAASETGGGNGIDAASETTGAVDVDAASETTGAVDVDDYINIIGQMEGRLAINMSITRFAYSRGNYQFVEVYGDKGALRYTLEENDALEINIGNEPMRFGHIWAGVPIPAKYASAQMQSFADILNGRADGLAADLADGLAVQRAIDGALRAAETGTRVIL